MSRLSKVKNDMRRMYPVDDRKAIDMQPVEQRFEKIEQRLAKIEQQQTEPIKVTIERRQTDAERTLDLHTEMLREHSEKLDMHTQGFQKVIEMLDVQQEAISALQADVISIKATQSDHGELLREHSKRFDKLEATQSEQGQKLDLILQLLQKKGE